MISFKPGLRLAHC